MRFPAALRCRAAASVLLLAPGTAGAADLPVDLELVLAVDISRSIDAEEARLQRLGYASALTNPRVLAAIRSGFLGRIAVTYVEWAGIGSGSPAVGWSVIADADDAAAFAGALVDRR
ncbi:MAG: DUF1194 domain-containing protein, partial [Inquilinus sp.]|nr:DUF1194 domain-containing protein [Inquilinus sp.]